jgi:hypothetical protein
MEQLPLPGEYLTGWVARPPSTARPQINQLRASGYSWQRIASRLNVDGIATPTGRGRWWAASVYQHANPERHADKMRGYRARHRTGM